MEVVGVPAYTLSRGEVLWADGKLDVQRGAGRHVDRPCFAPYYAAVNRRRELATPTPVER